MWMINALDHVLDGRRASASSGVACLSNPRPEIMQPGRSHWDCQIQSTGRKRVGLHGAQVVRATDLPTTTLAPGAPSSRTWRLPPETDVGAPGGLHPLEIAHAIILGRKDIPAAAVGDNDAAKTDRADIDAPNVTIPRLIDGAPDWSRPARERKW